MLYIAATLSRILDFPGIAGRPFQYLDRLIQTNSIARGDIESTPSLWKVNFRRPARKSLGQ